MVRYNRPANSSEVHVSRGMQFAFNCLVEFSMNFIDQVCFCKESECLWCLRQNRDKCTPVTAHAIRGSVAQCEYVDPEIVGGVTFYSLFNNFPSYADVGDWHCQMKFYRTRSNVIKILVDGESLMNRCNPTAHTYTHLQYIHIHTCTHMHAHTYIHI